MRQDQQKEAETSKIEKQKITITSFQLPIPTTSEVRYPWTFQIYEPNFFFLFAYLFPSKYNECVLGQSQEKAKRGCFLIQRAVNIKHDPSLWQSNQGQPFRGHCWGWDSLVIRYSQGTKPKGVSKKKLSNKKNNFLKRIFENIQYFIIFKEIQLMQKTYSEQIIKNLHKGRITQDCDQR